MLGRSVVVCLFEALKKKAKAALKSYLVRVQVEHIKSQFSPQRTCMPENRNQEVFSGQAQNRKNLTGTKCACLVT